MKTNNLTKSFICVILVAIFCATALLSACDIFSAFDKPNNKEEGETKYTLSYTRGAEDATGIIPNDELFKVGAEITLRSADTFNREGYRFTYWSDGTKTYAAESKFTMPAHDVILTAQWENKTQSPPDTSTAITATEIKFESGNLVFKGKAGGGVTSLVAYLFDTNEKINTYKATANIGTDRTFTVYIGLSQLTAAPGNWYYLLTSVNGGSMEKVAYSSYNKKETYEYGGREYKWQYSGGIAVSYENLQTDGEPYCEIDMSGVMLKAENDGHVYLSVSGNYSGYRTHDFGMDIQLQAGSYPRYNSDVDVTLKGGTFKVKMDISGAAASTDYYAIHLFIDGDSMDVATGSNPYIVETSATDDNNIYKLKSGKAWWDSKTYIMQLTIEAKRSKFSQNDYLKVNGADVKKNYGQGEKVMLRGTNVGGYFVTEDWMTTLNHGDYKTACRILENRFGYETMQELWAYYRSYYWSDQDFKNCADMGMTAIRLPFTYMNVDYMETGEYDFSALDDFVRGAAKYGIYTILDLHGAYGSQNGQDHSGEELKNSGQVDFYNNSEKKAKTVALWKALAEHYRGNPAVAAFDLLNEPGEKGGWTTTYHWNFFDEMYDAIREVDTDRIIIFESCWTGDSLPNPSRYGWQNCMYSFHHYVGETGEDGHKYSLSELNAKMRERIDDLNNKNFGIPLYMGEFTCYANGEFWADTLNLFKQYGWHWTSWTYKTNWSMGGWGIYYTSANNVNLNSNSIYDIKNKWRGTSFSYASDTSLGGKKLKDIIREALIG